MRILLSAFIGGLILAVLVLLDVAKPLGAHPWWSQKSLLIGAPVGLLLATVGARVAQPVTRLIFFAVLTVAAFAVAKYGQTQFAASYAEDALAGQLWYFGWIAIGVAVTATFTAAAQVFLRTP